MFGEAYQAVGKGAQGKVALLKKNPLGYVLSSMLAGMYIGIGCILMGFVGGCLSGQPAQKLICGIVFSVGLCFVTMAGAELFTGNNFVMASGALQKMVTWGQAAKLWVVCYFGNFLGSVLTAVIFWMTGIEQANEAVGTFLTNAALGKVSGQPANLFAKAILCNVLVCIAVWCSTKMKAEGAKMFMNFCCVGTFVTCGFEHSVANMTFLSIGLMDGVITPAGFLYNLVVVTLGNMVGGILFVALPYYLISRENA